MKNPQYKDKPFLIKPQEYDNPAKLRKNIDKMKEISALKKSSII